MAAYMEIKGQDVPGQAGDKNHTDWIPVLEVHQGVNRPLAFGADGSRQMSTCTFDDLMVTTKMGKHVPPLAQYIAKGTTFKSITIDVCTDQGGDAREPYYQIKLSDAVVSSLTVDNAEGGGSGDTVVIAFNSQKIEWTFTQWKGDEKAGDTTTTWNIEKNTP